MAKEMNLRGFTAAQSKTETPLERTMTRLASRSKLRLAGGNQRMTAAKVVPRLRDRTSKDRHCETANADHKGKYLARWTKDFRDTVDMTLYHWFSGINQSENYWAIFGAEIARTLPQDVAAKIKCKPLLSAQSVELKEESGRSLLEQSS